jgi:L-ribulose-5-phosphate 3-epimerase
MRARTSFVLGSDLCLDTLVTQSKPLLDRRRFLAAAGAAVAATASGVQASSLGPLFGNQTQPATSGKARFRTGLVAYSYRLALESKAMTYEDLIRIAVETGTDGIDMTVYWMPRTSDDYLLPLRRLAYRNRVEIYSIGTRVRLAQPAGALQDKELADLRKWVDVAERLGATHVRVFSGPKPDNATMEQAVAMASETLKRGAEYAGARGIILGLEDDGGLTDHAKETIAIVKGADSPWAGMNLDIGNFRPPDVYGQIEVSIPYAVSTHVKTEMALDDGKTRGPFDWDRVFTMFARQGFKGYMGLEYEASEDPLVAVPRYLTTLKAMAVKYSA